MSSMATLGFVFTDDTPFAGLDLDDCLDEHGDLLWGNDLLAEFDMYTEVSPSGTGFKLFLRGRKPDWKCCKKVVSARAATGEDHRRPQGVRRSEPLGRPR